MPRVTAAICSTLAAAAALAALPIAPAVAHSIQPAYLPAGRTQLNGKDGYAEVVYDKRTKKIDYVEIYYACRAAGPSKSRYPAFIGLDSQAQVGVHGRRAAGSYTEKITAEFDPKAIGDQVTVNWTLSDIGFSHDGLTGKLSFSVSGPATVCPFSVGARKLQPSGRPGDKNY
ncbi:MAG: hypothetical protein ACYCU0_07935 [Solirubrobacteraceae bacterium]